MAVVVVAGQHFSPVVGVAGGGGGNTSNKNWYPSAISKTKRHMLKREGGETRNGPRTDRHAYRHEAASLTTLVTVPVEGPDEATDEYEPSSFQF